MIFSNRQGRLYPYIHKAVGEVLLFETQELADDKGLSLSLHVVLPFGGYMIPVRRGLLFPLSPALIMLSFASLM